MAQLTPQQRAALRAAEETGRAFVTLIDGRIAILLPASDDDTETTRRLERVAAALENAGI